jgi:hypothetical protein
MSKESQFFVSFSSISLSSLYSAEVKLELHNILHTCLYENNFKTKTIKNLIQIYHIAIAHKKII